MYSRGQPNTAPFISNIDIDVKKFAQIFFNNWYWKHRLPANIFFNREKLFTSKFWQPITKIAGVKLKMSMAFHPQTNGSSKRTNKTVNEAVCYHVTCNRVRWVWALPHFHFHMMNTVNGSTSFTGFQLSTGLQTPCVIPPLILPPATGIVSNNLATQQALKILLG